MGEARPDPALRFPAEWEPQSGILLAWPHAGTDWAERLAEVEDTYIALVAAITRFEPAVVCVPDDDLEAYARAEARRARAYATRASAGTQTPAGSKRVVGATSAM